MEPSEKNYVETWVGYCRVSTLEQKMHGISVAAQVNLLQEYAKKHGANLDRIYIDEGISGTKPIAKRPALQEMIHDAQRKPTPFTKIIFIKLDRYFRSVAEYHECQKILESVGVEWEATQEEYSTATANGRLMINLRLAIAEAEAATGSERVRIANEYKVKEGLPLFGTTSMPFCYAVVQKEGDKHKRIIKKPGMEHVMEDLIEHFMRFQSIHATAVYINNKYGAGMQYNSFKKLLSNEMICGRYRGNDNYCDPYVTPEEFDAIQEMMKKNPRTSKENRIYIFSGLIRCPVCGWALAGQPHKNKERRYYNTYRCNQYKASRHNCRFSKMVFEGTVERQMLARIEEFLETAKTQSVEIVAEKERVSKYNLDELEQELERLNYAWQKGRIKGGVAQYDREYDELMVKIEAAKAEEKDFQRVNYAAAEAVLASDWRTIYDALDAEHKRAFWRSFVSEIHIKWETDSKEIVDVKFL